MSPICIHTEISPIHKYTYLNIPYTYTCIYIDIPDQHTLINMYIPYLYMYIHRLSIYTKISRICIHVHT